MNDHSIPVEALIEFPADFSFKVVGRHSLVFPQSAREAVQNVLGQDRDIQVRSRLSGKARYMSVTLTARVESADELREVYANLRKLKDVITVL